MEKRANLSSPWIILGVLTLCSVASASTDRYRVEEQFTDSKTVTIIQGSRRVAVPKTEPEQEGAEQAKVSTDGRTVGWAALNANCCTSYPLPTVLVLYRNGKVIRRIQFKMMIYDWAFGSKADEVVTRHGLPHGPEYSDFILRRISDGKQLAEFDCGEQFQTRVPRPAWSRVIKVQCPNYSPPPDAAAKPTTAPVPHR